MSDIAISNGTCYTAAGERLGDGFIPCGNTAYGYQTCCGAGDNCLADLACFGIHGTGYGSYLTYFAGCTDPNYEDASCPQKQVDQPWVALTLCDDAPAWAICSQPGNPSTLQPGATCSCTSSASATIAFVDARTLANHVSLPGATGEAVSEFPGYTLSGTLTSESAAATGAAASTSGGGSGTSASSASATASPGSSRSSSGSRTTTNASSRASSANAASSSSNFSQGGSSASDSSSSSGLGTGAIVGIVIGAIAAVLIIAALAFIFFRRKRRRDRATEEKNIRDSGMSTSPMKPGGLGEYVRPKTPPNHAEVDSHPIAGNNSVAEVAGRPMKPWEMRSELDGREVPSSRASALAPSEKGSHLEPPKRAEDGSERFEMP